MTASGSPWHLEHPARGQAPGSAPSPGPVPAWGRWTLVCAAAEVVGMAAAATAAGLGLALVGEPDSWGTGGLVWLLAVLGGAVEGLAVGGLQRRVLLPFLPGLSAPRFVGATVAVALLGWGLGMAFPSFVAWQAAPGATQASSGPPWLLTVAGGAVLGAVTGALFGAAQAWALRPHVLHAGRWVWANVWGWAVAMTVMMVGASTPSGPWPWPALLALAAVTGLLAGAAVGAVTGLFLPSLRDDAPAGGTWVNRVVLWVLRGPAHRLLSGSLLDLSYVGRRSGRGFALPVQYAEVHAGSCAVDSAVDSAAGTAADHGTGTRELVVVPGRPARKSWWRGFTTPAPCSLTWRGRRCSGTARVVRGDGAAVAAYRARWPKAEVTSADPVVRITVAGPRPGSRPG